MQNSLIISLNSFLLTDRVESTPELTDDNVNKIDSKDFRPSNTLQLKLTKKA